MFERTVDEQDLATLKAAREEADERYRRALTEFDRAIHAIEEYPHPPPPPDEFQITPLNRLWEIVPKGGAENWRARVVRFLFRPIIPLFERQQSFNSAVVDHINRNLLVMRETQKAAASVISLMQFQLTSIHLHAMAYLQQITPYIDTKDQEFVGLMRRVNEDVAESVARLDERVDRLDLLPGIINMLAEEALKHYESMNAREQRFDARVSALRLAQQDAAVETRAALSRMQHAMTSLRQELEGSPIPSRTTERSTPEVGTSTCDRAASDRSAPVSMDPHRYVGFEELFRGSQEEIRKRVVEYLPDFGGASDVLDVGCGRGEFLDVLKEHGIAARGLDINRDMVEICRARGLDVVEADALAYIEGLADGSLGGVFAAQVIEHLEPDYLMRFLDACFSKLRPGAKIVLETINPACWFAFFQSYIRDITHVRALHPDTMRYLMVASAFREVEVRYRAPYPEHAKLQQIPRPASDGTPAADARQDLVDTFNENVEKINHLLFTYLDYAVIGTR